MADRRADGSIILKSTEPLREARVASATGWSIGRGRRRTRIFLGDRASVDAPWRTVTYKDALKQVRAAAAWILAQGLSAERPLVILSDNSVEHALFALAAQHVGVPSAAISPAYSLMSQRFRQAQEHDQAAAAGRDLCLRHKAVRGGAGGDRAAAFGHDRQRQCRRCRAISFRAIAATPETPDVAKAFAAVTPDTIAKFLFTSGSTGTPKAVINTQRMLTSSQQAKAQTWSFLERRRAIS